MLLFFHNILQGRWLIFPLFLLLFLNSCRTSRIYKPYNPNFTKEKHIGFFPATLAETSGLQVYGDSLITFNDSGGKPGIYVFSPNSPEKPLYIDLPGTVNLDWEDVAADSNYLYIGDIGNNIGNRDTLKIYCIEWSDLENRIPRYHVISFRFTEMTDAHRNKWGNPFDCEAMAVIGDSIWLFTKNWQDESSWIYKLPAKPGHYDLKSQSAFFPGMLVTGADYHADENLLLLIGYHGFRPRIRGYFYDGSSFRDYFFIRFGNLPGVQTEGITIKGSEVYFNNERSLKRQGLYRFELNENIR